MTAQYCTQKKDKDPEEKKLQYYYIRYYPEIAESPEVESKPGGNVNHDSMTVSKSASIGRLRSNNGGTALSSQVGGHAGMLSSEDGTLVIKPCLPLEKEFYTALAVDVAAATTAVDWGEGGDNLRRTSGPFTHLSPWVPKFYGVLRLEGHVVPNATAPTRPEDVIIDVEGAGEKDES
jgi:hypothetical protein